MRRACGGNSRGQRRLPLLGVLTATLLAVCCFPPVGVAASAASATTPTDSPLTSPGNAVVPDSDFTDFTVVTMGASDDGSWPCGPSGVSFPVACPVDGDDGPAPFPFGFAVDYFGNEYSGVYINTNGNITFGNYLSTFTPFGVDTGGIPIIAPFFADVDTVAGGATVQIGTGLLNGDKAFVVDWPGVACYATGSVTDNFQVILIDRPDLGTGSGGDDFQIEFNYDSIEWDAGQASGGNASCTGAPNPDSAVVGFSDGSTTPGHSYTLAGSQTSRAFLDANTTTGLIYNELNSDVPGRYVFNIVSGTPSAPTTLTTSLSGDGQSGTSISVPEGSDVTDAATLSGSNVVSAGGTVSYGVYGNPSCTDVVASAGTVEVTDGSVPPSAAVSLPSPGTYYWHASYSGDAENDASTSGCSEIETVTVPPGTTTSGVVEDGSSNTAWNGSEVTGSTAYDTATISTVADIGPVPTGSVTYAFFGNATCGGDPLSTDTVPLSGPSVPPSSATPPLPAGSYGFEATYSGDSTYESSASGCQSFSVLVATPAVGSVVDDAATHGSWSGNEATNASAEDTATVAGVAGFTPTGSVTYDLYGNGTCSGHPVSTDTKTISGGAVPDSGATPPLRAGPYSYEASYSGDSNYAAEDGPCEPFTVLKAPKSVGSVVDASDGSAWDGTEVTGASAVDTAFITPLGAIAPRGTVTYDFFGNGTCSGEPATSQTVALEEDGDAPPSQATDPLVPGSYSFQATYSGDSDYLAASGSCEPFSVAKASPSVGTVVDDAAAGAPWAGNEVTGALADDTATVSGVVGFDPTGTATYSFFGDGTCSGEASATESVSLSAGAVPDSSATAPLPAGSYSYEASYSGDADYLPSTGECESFTVLISPDVLATSVDDAGTTQGWSGDEVTGATASDTSQVEAAGTGSISPTGTVTYELFGNGTCSGEATASESVRLSAGAVPDSSSTAPLAAGSYGYLASYGGDGNYLPSTGECESFTVLISPDVLASSVVDAATTQPWSGDEVAGAEAYDAAQLEAPGMSSIIATGRVTYRFFGDGTCSGPASTLTVSVLGGHVPPSNVTAALAAGDYSFEASYAGDTNYLTSTSQCDTFSVGPTTSAVSSVVHDAVGGGRWSGLEVTGASAFDVAAVTGAWTASPTGSVTYLLFPETACTGTPVTTDTVALSGGAVPPSTDTASLPPGTYSYSAVYSGDGNYEASTGPCENFSVMRAASGTAQRILDSATNKPWSGTELQGASAYDAAAVAGVPGYPPSGDIAYDLFGNGSCSGTPRSSQTVKLAAGTAEPSQATAGLGPGSYSYRASYSGDADYEGSTSACEAFTVIALGYRLIGGDGSVFDYRLPFYGSVPGLGQGDPLDFVGAADSSRGYWLVDAHGDVVSFGNAHFHGSLLQRGVHVDDIVGMAATPNGGGYWLVASDGTVYAFGDAVTHGTLAGRGIHVHDVVAIMSPGAGGYWLVGATGAVYNFGDAGFLGSCPQAGSGCQGITDIVAAAHFGSGGYWLVSKTGQVFGFGTVHSLGSCSRAGSGCRGTHTIVGIGSPDANGYWLVEAGGRVVPFGDAKWFGDERGTHLTRPIVGIV